MNKDNRNTFKTKFFNFLAKPIVTNIITSATCILIGLVIGFLLLLCTNPSESLDGISSLAFGPLFTTNNFNKYFIGAITKSAPIILAGLSVLFAYKTGMFNIGGPGQMLIGAFIGVAICLTCPIKNAFTPFLAMIGGFAGGAIWGFLVGFLKAHFHVHEVISAIMLNYIATYLVAWLVKMPAFFESSIAQTKYIDASVRIPTLGLDKLFPKSNLDISFIIVIIIAILIWFILNKTTLGFQLKATGLNKDAANNSSMNYKRNIKLSMLIAGGLSGLGGAILFISTYSSGIKPEIELLPQGFDGISVALLGSLNPIAAIFSGFFIQYLRNGGQLMMIYTNYATEIADIVISIIIYCSALTALIKIWIDRLNQKHKEDGSKGKGFKIFFFDKFRKKKDKDQILENISSQELASDPPIGVNQNDKGGNK